MKRRECLTMLGALVGVRIGVARPLNKWSPWHPDFLDAVKFDGAVDYIERPIDVTGLTDSNPCLLYTRDNGDKTELVAHFGAGEGSVIVLDACEEFDERELDGVPVLKTGIDPSIWNPNKREER